MLRYRGAQWGSRHHWRCTNCQFVCTCPRRSLWRLHVRARCTCCLGRTILLLHLCVRELYVRRQVRRPTFGCVYAREHRTCSQLRHCVWRIHVWCRRPCVQCAFTSTNINTSSLCGLHCLIRCTPGPEHSVLRVHGPAGGNTPGWRRSRGQGGCGAAGRRRPADRGRVLAPGHPGEDVYLMLRTARVVVAAVLCPPPSCPRAHARVPVCGCLLHAYERTAYSPLSPPYPPFLHADRGWIQRLCDPQHCQGTLLAGRVTTRVIFRGGTPARALHPRPRPRQHCVDCREQGRVHALHQAPGGAGWDSGGGGGAQTFVHPVLFAPGATKTCCVFRSWSSEGKGCAHRTWMQLFAPAVDLTFCAPAPRSMAMLLGVTFLLLCAVLHVCVAARLCLGVWSVDCASWIASPKM